MRKQAWLTILTLTFAASAASAEAWDHRAMQSHHRATKQVEPPLAEGETRFGRITIGAANASNAQLPGTIEHTTQRQWQQRTSWSDVPSLSSGWNAPEISAGRHDGNRRRPGSGGGGSIGRGR
jgi:hypothetical protein